MIKEKKVGSESIHLISELDKVIKKYPEIKVVFLFGSLAEGRSNTLSDIDLAYLAFPETEIVEDVNYDICCFLKTNEVDLVNLNHIPLSSKYNIISEGKLLYCSDKVFLADYKEKLFNEYCDFLPYLKEYHACFIKNMK